MLINDPNKHTDHANHSTLRIEQHSTVVMSYINISVDVKAMIIYLTANLGKGSKEPPALSWLTLIPRLGQRTRPLSSTLTQSLFGTVSLLDHCELCRNKMRLWRFILKSYCLTIEMKLS